MSRQAGEEDWPPPEARLQSALWRAEGHLLRAEYAKAAVTLEDVSALAGPDDRGFVRGLHHLAAAGVKACEGEPERAARQLEHARRRLAPFPAEHLEVDAAALVEAVARDVQG
jgi:hypothetical protein